MLEMDIPITHAVPTLYRRITNGYTDDPVTIPENLRLFRVRKGLRQEDVAESMDIAQSTVSKWERGEAAPDLVESSRLAKLYGVTVNNFVSGPDAPQGTTPVTGPGVQHGPHNRSSSSSSSEGSVA